VLQIAAVHLLFARFGRPAVVRATRTVLADLREHAIGGDGVTADQLSESRLAAQIQARLERDAQPSLRPIFNLTGTVLHTNLGRAPLPRAAIDAVQIVLGQPSNLEYDLERGARGDRDAHVETLLRELTGAQAATVVNNNAAAVLLVLNSLALRKEVIVSRGELVEIGDAFRIPDIMARAGCRLREVGTTNRTHTNDFEHAIGARTALLMKVHTSNYTIEGFTAAVPEATLADLAHARGLPFVVDLGSGTLIDLAAFGLPHEPTVQEALAHGADLVTFSGDKLLGGPQAGLIVGRKDLIDRIKRNPLKRALRVDKMTLAALEAVLGLYRNPDTLAQHLPALQLLTRPLPEIAALAARIQPVLARAFDGLARVSIEPAASQIGSGALPVDVLPSRAVAITPLEAKRGAAAALRRWAAAFRALPIPVIGTIAQGAVRFDVRCLTDEAAFVAQLAQLELTAPAGDGDDHR
jgi:L-seryl-tRNA(Ser) seleniumtransferase